MYASESEFLSTPDEGICVTDSDAAALRDVLWKMYQENWVQGRHHEVQRSAVASALTALSAAILGLVTFDDGLTRSDWPLTSLLAAIGAFGVVFSAKHYERFDFHLERARAYRDALDDLLLNAPLAKGRQEADSRSRVWLLTDLRLSWLWYLLSGMIFIIGVVLTVMAVYWPILPPTS